MNEGNQFTINKNKNVDIVKRYFCQKIFLFLLLVSFSKGSYSKGIFGFFCRFLVNRSDTNCWNCVNPCSTLYYPISTILSILGAWIYFWAPSKRFRTNQSWTSLYILDTLYLILQCVTQFVISHSLPQTKDHIHLVFHN